MKEWWSISFVGNGHCGNTAVRAVSLADAVARFKKDFPAFADAKLVVRRSNSQ